MISGNIKTITKKEVKEFELLFYRPSSFFGKGIAIYDALHAGSLKGFWRIITNQAFSHVAITLKKDGVIRRFDAMEGMKTGFRKTFGKCYVFSLKLTIKEKNIIRKHLLSRNGSSYDNKGIGEFLFPGLVYEDEFKDFCSELQSNALLLTGSYPELEGKRATPYMLYSILRPKLTFIGLLIK